MKNLRTTTRLGLERLEARDVPTVVFNPHFGAMTTQGADVAMQNPTVNFVFSGAYWNPTGQGPTGQGGKDEATMLASARNILGPTYLSGLIQYGSDGKATMGASWNDNGTFASQPSTAALQNFLQGSITSHHATPGSNDLRHAPIYVVISDPTSAASFDGGWNAPGKYSLFTSRYIDHENMHMIWLGTKMSGGAIDKDAYTSVLSHELAETISDPTSNAITVTPPAGLPASFLGHGHQISDFEPEPAGVAHYGYRFNGDVVQPYWSRADNAFIVPDGNRQKFYLDPIWSGSTFTEKYNLSVRGDQLGTNYNDFIRLSHYGNSSSRVEMNGETADFDKGTLSSIDVNTGGGSNQVRVNGVEAGVTLNVNSFGQSNDVVFISETGSLTGIQGATVNVSNASGHTRLIVDGMQDGARNVVINDHSVDFSGLAAINYTGGRQQGDGSVTGVTALEVWDGSGVNAGYINKVVSVDSKPAYTDVTLYGSYGDWVWGNAASLITVNRNHY